MILETHIVSMVPNCTSYSQNFFKRVAEDYAIPHFVIPYVFNQSMKRSSSLLGEGQGVSVIPNCFCWVTFAKKMVNVFPIFLAKKTFTIDIYS